MPALTVVFDLDGTLVDTAPDLIATLNAIFARENLAPVPYDVARTQIGAGARALILRGLELQGARLPPSEIDRLFRAFLSYYADHIADGSQPFAGLDGALDLLEEAGCRLAVCTNKLEGLSIRLLDALGLASRFKAICGQDTFGVQKPDPEMLIRTIARAGGRVDSAVMVGDSGTDIMVARAAGIPVIAVDFGYTETPVGELGPDRVISHFAELPQAVASITGDRTVLTSLRVS